jgi:hypothetical protein
MEKGLSIDYTIIISIITSITTLVTVILGFILQMDKRKLRNLERDNKTMRSHLNKSLTAIRGYQLIEDEIAKEKGHETTSYYKAITKKGKEEYFIDREFLQPNRITTLLERYKA